MEIDPPEDLIVTRLPIYFSNGLEPNLHIHQFPLLSRPLQAPPSAVSAGKRIKARIKPAMRRMEINVPVDTRPDVWNLERGTMLGQARIDDDREKNQELAQVKQREGEEPRLSEVRMQSERVMQKGAYMLGVVRDGVFAITCIVTELTWHG
jgi:DNA-directed RNA polymerase-3 subunit RPC5